LIDRNGNNINGVADDYNLDVDDAAVELVYGEDGWTLITSGQIITTIQTGGGGSSFIYQSISGAANVVPEYYYLANTSGGTFALILPTAPTLGDRIGFADSAASFATNALVLDPGTENIGGVSGVLTLNVDGMSVVLVYSGVVDGWTVLSDGDLLNAYISSHVELNASGLVAPMTSYIVDTSGGVVEATLPSSPQFGDEIEFIDGTGSFSTNNLTIIRNGKNIMGLDEDMIVSTDDIYFKLVYYNATNGWRVTQ